MRSRRSEENIGLGVIGVGGIGRMHIHQLSEIQGATLVALCDIDRETGKKLAKRYKVQDFYTDYKKLIDKDSVHGIVICTPPDSHDEITAYAAQAGKHVLCEKPISTTLKQADSMIDTAKSSGIKLMMAYCERFVLAFSKTKEMITEGKIGKPIMIRANRRGDYLWIHGRKRSHWIFDWKAGGGPIIEQGIHDVDYVRWFFGCEATRVYAEIGSLAWPHKLKCGDNAGMLVRFENDGIGIIDQSWTMPKHFPFDVRCEVIGTRGRIDIDLLKSNLMFKSTRGIEARGARIKERYPYDLSRNPTVGGGYSGELRHFVECIKQNKEPLVTGVDGKKDLEIVLACYESSQKKKPVDLSTH